MEEEKIEIPAAFCPDIEGNWVNQLAFRIKGGESREEKILDAKTRLQKYNYDCRIHGKEVVDKPNHKGIIQSY